MADLLSGILDLSRAAPAPLHVQITDQIKRAVLAGTLPARQRLPSSRAMAAGLAVSRNTVVAALDQLKAEGFLESMPGSGVRVAVLPEPDLLRAKPAKSLPRRHRLAAHWDAPLAAFQPVSLAHPKPFQPGIPDLTAFPHELWSTALRRAARLPDPASAGYGHMSGHPRLRRALCRHLAEARGVAAEPEQIIVTSSARGGLSLLTNALLSPGEDCWIEEPGFRSAKAIFAAHGGRLVPVPVDAQGIDPSRAPPASTPRLIYTTPSHQYPTGAVMTLARRLDLLDAAARAGAYIIEDDYDSEFQYRGRPIAALQGLDRSGSVLYLGTFSKSLLPAIRVGFLVVPAGLVEAFEKVHRHTGQFVPPVIQLALADLLERGQYAAHVRRMKSIYAGRLAAFCDGVARHSGGALAAAMPDGGLQTVVTSRDGLEDEALAAHLTGAGVHGQPLSDFHISPAQASHRGLLMGFAAWGEHEAAKALARLGGLYG